MGYYINSEIVPYNPLYELSMCKGIETIGRYTIQIKMWHVAFNSNSKVASEIMEISVPHFALYCVPAIRAQGNGNTHPCSRSTA